MIILNAEQMKRAELSAVEAQTKTTLLDLMENAGKAAADFILNEFDIEGKKIVIICGKGNNGGDGYVIARHLSLRANVVLIMALGEPSTEDSKAMFEKCGDASKIYYAEDKEKATEHIDKADILVDCIFGIGFKGTARGTVNEIIEFYNKSDAIKVSVDIPSGINSDSGYVNGCCIKADYTVTFTALKPCHEIYPAKGYCGIVKVADVGIDEDCYKDLSNISTTEFEDIKKSWPERKINSNKSDFGRLLSICGSVPMPGAAVFAAKASMRCGLGLLYCASPKDIVNNISSQITEAVLLPLEQNTGGRINRTAIPYLISKLKENNACLIGCGLGLDDDTTEIVSEIVTNSKIPLIIDADGINAISLNKDILKRCSSDIIITPHPGEMARLCETSAGEIQNHRLEYAVGFAEKYGVIVVLKGANTIIASENGVYINTTGNSGMAKAGSGDVLAGIISSLAAQGITPLNAAVYGAYIHGMAGDISARKLSKAAMLPSDMVSVLPEIFLKLEKG